MKLPPPLQKGDTVALVSPARFVDYAEVEHFIGFAQGCGWNVRADDACFLRYRQFGGDDQARANHLQTMLSNDEVKAVFCNRGGYGSLRIVDSIDFSGMTKKPKWIVGFSDITVFHAHLQAMGVGSLHAPMPFNFGQTDERTFHVMRQFLEGQPQPTQLKPHPLNRVGKAMGIITGGNLSILYALKGSKSMPDLQGKILFIEDVDEYLYHIDRMMLGLKRAGLLSGLAGLVVGAFTEIKDNTIPFGSIAEEIVREHINEFNFPVCFGFPAGHIKLQHPLLFGAKIHLNVSESFSSITYQTQPSE
jgi:muramoyltetrapeptide carboxypeptidase